MKITNNKDDNFNIDSDRLKTHLKELSAFGRNPERGISRIAFSGADNKARQWLIEKMQRAGLQVWVDPASNIHGQRDGRESNLPAILFGSHIDSVPEAGIFDGTLGSLGALEIMETLSSKNIETRHPLRMVIWSDEEGIHFGQGLFGSRAATAGPKRGELELTGDDGLSLSEWIERYGLEPSKIDRAIIDPKKIAAYFELHIEQGPHLYRSDIPIGIVQGIVGIYRFNTIVEGFANHAGTTPMIERRDALLSASKLTQAVHQEVKAQPGNQVGNIGLVKVLPGAPNVIPGKVQLSIELRDLDENVVMDVFNRIRKRAHSISAEDRTHIEIMPFASEGPALMDAGLQNHIEDVAKDVNLNTLRLPSGAGHDAQNIARHGIPTGMIFVKSKEGVSHNPAEWTDWEDCARGVEMLYRSVISLDES